MVAELEGGGNWERSVEGSGIGGKKVEEIARRHQPATCPSPQLLPLISHLEAQLNTDPASMPVFLAVQDSSITDIVGPLVGLSVRAN